MEIHDRLRSLRERVGPAVFEDADSFHSALQDFMVQPEVGDGDLSLLVDAVRVGAVKEMQRVIANGGEPASAVEAAGKFLTAHRRFDLRDACWACAAIGFALGTVGDADVRRFLGPVPDPGPTIPDVPIPPNQETRPAEISIAKPTIVGTPAVGSTLTAMTGSVSPADARVTYAWQVDGRVVGTEPTYTPHESDSGKTVTVTATATHPTTGQTTQQMDVVLVARASTSRTRTFVAIGLGAVLLLGGGGVAAFLLARDGDSKLDLATVQERFSGLGSKVTHGLDACKDTDAPAGQEERLECGFDSGTLTLSTFKTKDALERGRASVVTDDQGNLYSKQSKGVYFSRTFTSDSGDVDFVYWDSITSLQSATYTADANPDDDVEEVTALAGMFKRADANVTFPAAVEDANLEELVGAWKIAKCERIHTQDPDELEESLCDATGSAWSDTDTLYVVRSSDTAALKAYRAFQKKAAKSDKQRVEDQWHFVEDGKTEGTLLEYVDSDKNAYVYWDQDSCSCYILAVGEEADLPAMKRWWDESAS